MREYLSAGALGDQATAQPDRVSPGRQDGQPLARWPPRRYGGRNSMERYAPAERRPGGWAKAGQAGYADWAGGGTMDAASSGFRDFEHAGWEGAAAAYAEYWGPLTRQAVEPLLDAVGAGPGVRLLDVATGPGYVAAGAG